MDLLEFWPSWDKNFETLLVRTEIAHWNHFQKIREQMLRDLSFQSVSSVLFSFSASLPLTLLSFFSHLLVHAFGHDDQDWPKLTFWFKQFSIREYSSPGNSS